MSCRARYASSGRLRIRWATLARPPVPGSRQEGASRRGTAGCRPPGRGRRERARRAPASGREATRRVSDHRGALGLLHRQQARQGGTKPSKKPPSSPAASTPAEPAGVAARTRWSAASGSIHGRHRSPWQLRPGRNNTTGLASPSRSTATVWAATGFDIQARKINVVHSFAFLSQVSSEIYQVTMIIRPACLSHQHASRASGSIEKQMGHRVDRAEWMHGTSDMGFLSNEARKECPTRVSAKRHGTAPIQALWWRKRRGGALQLMAPPPHRVQQRPGDRIPSLPYPPYRRGALFSSGKVLPGEKPRSAASGLCWRNRPPCAAAFPAVVPGLGRWRVSRRWIPATPPRLCWRNRPPCAAAFLAAVPGRGRWRGRRGGVAAPASPGWPPGSATWQR